MVMNRPAPNAPEKIPPQREKAAGEPPTVDWNSVPHSCALIPIAGAQPEPDEPDEPEPPAPEPQPAERLHTFPQLYRAEPIDLLTFPRRCASWGQS